MFCSYLMISMLLGIYSNAYSTGSIHPLLGRRQAQRSSKECHLLIPTDIWTNCSTILTTYGISLSNFVAANAGLDENCSGFAPGKPYCVAQAVESSLSISNDSRCGVQKNWTNTCIGSTYGSCWYDALYPLRVPVQSLSRKTH